MTLNIRTWLPAGLRRLITGWVLAALLEYLLVPVELRPLGMLAGLAEMSLGRVILLTLAFSGLMWCASIIWNTEKAERWVLFSAFLLLSGAGLWVSFSWGFLGLCGLIWAALLVYAFRGWRRDTPQPTPKKAHWAWVAATAAAAGAFFLFVSTWTVLRYRTFCTPSFDFGLFAQMFHNMKETGLPITTLERDGALSHFKVHMSPIYYLMLPFYCLFPDPATLQVLQAAVLASAAIPMWLIGKQHGLSAPVRTLLCALLMAYPALAGGAGYDIHENCFLTPLILWLFYSIHRKNTLLTAIFTLLTLMVKEDAAVYVGVIALWLIVRTLLGYQKEALKELLTGIAMLAVALTWFFAVTGYLAESGDGVMTYRYDNLMYDGSDSLITVVWAVIMCPLKVLYECVDPEKLGYIAQMLLPLLGLPLLTRRYERYLLLIPFLLVNLVSDYQYQHNILFQYSFGSLAFLFYLTAVNLADWRPEWLKLGVLGAALLVSLFFFNKTVIPAARIYPEYNRQYAEYYQGLRDSLSRIPKDASVAATTFNTAFLSERAELYDLRYASQENILKADYVVAKSGGADFKRFADPGKDNGYEKFTAWILAHGYELWESNGSLQIYKKP